MMLMAPRAILVGGGKRRSPLILKVPPTSSSEMQIRVNLVPNSDRIWPLERRSTTTAVMDVQIW
jgi:hypothetical protein